MQKNRGFTVIEALLVTVVTGTLGLFSHAWVEASEDTSYLNELKIEASNSWAQRLSQCQALRLTSNCNRLLSTRSSIEGMVLFLQAIPDSRLTNFSNHNFRLFGSQDSRGENYELQVQAGAKYDFTYTGGGGVVTLASTDFVPGNVNELAVELKQSGAEFLVKIWVDGQLELDRLVVGQLDHSNQEISIGEWAHAGRLQPFTGKVAVMGVLLN